MSKDYKDASFKNLLQKLQEESWQLELLISGFAIFGLFSAVDPIRIAFISAQNDGKIYSVIILIIALVSCWILLFNLLLHVILRGLWIGALGLRYVSGDIDYEVLNYSPKFTKYLQKKVGSFDKYISKLEIYCSVIFAISFLLIFYVLAFIFTLLCIVFIANYILDDEIFGPASTPIGIVLILFTSIGMILTFIDFITQGGLKRKKWLSKIYFPVYWVFSFITFSFLYRPLVYNFLDNKFGKRLSFIIIPLYVVILIIGTLQYRSSNYISPLSASSDIHAKNTNYEDQLTEESDFIINAVIPSKVITKSFLKVFIAFTDNVENNVFNFNEGIRPKKDTRGLITDVVRINFNNNEMSSKKLDSIKRVYLKTINEIYNLKIDSVAYDSGFILAENTKNQFGFETYLNIKDLPEGKHLLNITRKRIRRGDTISTYLERIPFWHYKD